MNSGEAGRSGASVSAAGARGHGDAAEQPVRAHDQHHRHHHEFGDQRELGEIDGEVAEMHGADADAQRLDLGDQHRGEIGAGDRAHAADHHDDEGVAEHGEVHPEIGGLAGKLQRAAEPGEERARGEHRGEQQRLVDAERADHGAVLGRRPHQPPEPRAPQHEMQDQQHDGPRRDQHQVVAREAAAEDVDGIAQAGRARAEQVLRAPQPQRRVVDDEHEREGREQLEQFGHMIDAAQQQHLDHRADRGDAERRENDAAPIAEPAADRRRDRVGEIDAEHVERAVGHVDDPRHAEDQRQAGADKEQPGGAGEAVERLEQDRLEGHGRPLLVPGEAGAPLIPPDAASSPRRPTAAPRRRRHT